MKYRLLFAPFHCVKSVALSRHRAGVTKVPIGRVIGTITKGRQALIKINGILEESSTWRKGVGPRTMRELMVFQTESQARSASRVNFIAQLNPDGRWEIGGYTSKDFNYLAGVLD